MTLLLNPTLADAMLAIGLCLWFLATVLADRDCTK